MHCDRSQDVVPVGLHCTGCDYDLRGLRLEGKCPECGQFIRQSFDRLVVAVSASELRQMKSSLSAVYLLVPLGFIGLLLGGLLLAALPLGPRAVEVVGVALYVGLTGTGLSVLAFAALRGGYRPGQPRATELGVAGCGALWLLGTLAGLASPRAGVPFRALWGHLALLALVSAVALFLQHLGHLTDKLSMGPRSARAARATAIQLGAVALLLEAICLYTARPELGALLAALALLGLVKVWWLAGRCVRRLGKVVPHPDVAAS